MAINLQKGQRISVELKNVCVGLGWDPADVRGQEFDLDASAFMLGSNQRIPEEKYFIFYNNKTSPDGAVEGADDDRTGGSSDGDDESIRVNLSKVSEKIQEIVFVVTIHNADALRQNFGQVRNSFIRLYNEETNEELAKYELDEDFSVETGVEFGRLYRKDGSWRFEAIGRGYRGGLQFFVDKYV